LLWTSIFSCTSAEEAPYFVKVDRWEGLMRLRGGHKTEQLDWMAIKQAGAKEPLGTRPTMAPRTVLFVCGRLWLLVGG
jgi:hypothetical protein